MGVKIPWPGYLDPTQLFVSKISKNTVCYQNCCNILCYHCDKINSVGLNKKKISFFSHTRILLGIMGGGQDTLGGVS